MAKKIIIIGGSAAGPKAAARARRMDYNAEITIIQKDHDLSMASCGYPYYVGGFFDDRNMLISTPTGVTRDSKFFMNAKGIVARVDTEVIAINREKKNVLCKSCKDGTEEIFSYDTLIIATGALPRIPHVPGYDLKGVTTLQNMNDVDYLRKVRDEGVIKKAVVIGGGLIGVETCEALHLAGIDITVIELSPQILMFLDWEIAKLLENHIKSKAAQVITDNGVASFLGENGILKGVKLQNGTELVCDLAVLAIGVVPNSHLAKAAGLNIGKTGGIEVNEYMQTSDPDIYAVGDCVEVRDRLTGDKVHAPYGDLANLEGRVAGENAALGNVVTFPGTVRTGICKVFDYNAGSTGLSDSRAISKGFDAVSVIVSSLDKPVFMKGRLLVSKLVADRKSGKILGFQCVGSGDVSKQVAIAAMAIQGNLTINDLSNADLPYAPPFSPALDTIITAAHVLQNKIKGRMQGISPKDVKELIDRGEKPYLLDVRGPDEYEVLRLGVGEILIPLGALRKRLHELPQDKNARIIVYCKISLRGYEAQLILNAEGWKNVSVMEGGIMAWPYPKEK